jgi:hypothetical protein
MNDDEIRLRPDEIRPGPRVIRIEPDDENKPDLFDYVGEIVIGFVTIVGVAVLIGHFRAWLAPIVNQYVGGFVRWLLSS